MAKLKANFKKIDLSGIKQFFIAKGEKVALGVFAGLGFVLVVFGLYGAVTSDRTKDGKDTISHTLKENATKLEEAMRSAGNYVEGPTGSFRAEWTLYRSYFPFLPMIPIAEEFPPKRLNPDVLAVPIAEMQIDYVKAAALVYDIIRDGEKAYVFVTSDGKGGKEKNEPDNKRTQTASNRIVETLKPTRMIVVSTLFPMKDQRQEFEKKLRVAMDDLVPGHDDFPKILGINVKRVVIKADGTKDDPIDLIWVVDGKNTIKVAPHKDDFLRQAHIDPDGLKPYENHFYSGVQELLPKLVNGSYPPVRLKRFVPVKDTPGGKGPKNMPFKTKDLTSKPRDLKGGVRDGGNLGTTTKTWDELLPNQDEDAGLTTGAFRPGTVGLQPNSKLDSMKALVDRFRGNKYPIFAEAEVGNVKKDAKGLPTTKPAIKKDQRPGPGPGPGPGPRPGQDKKVNGPIGPNNPPFGLKDPKENREFKDPKENREFKDPKENGEPKVASRDGQKIYDPLIRFFDVDVEPGVTYEYQIQVRMANPNYERKDEVANPSDADKQELRSEWVTTNPITIPAGDEYFVYAVDAWARPEPKKAVDPKGKLPGFDPMDMKKDFNNQPPPGVKGFPPPDKGKPPFFKPGFKPEDPKKVVNLVPQPCGPDTAVLEEKLQRVPVQLHRWFGTAPDTQGGLDFIIAGWVVAERVLVRRGEFIGRSKLTVQAPTWSKEKETFEVLLLPPVEEHKLPAKQALPPPPGITLDFSADPAPLLVDFDGGPKSLTLPNRFVPVREECAMDLMILNPDGKLVVRNSQLDFEDRENDGERLKRHQAYRDRVKEFTRAPQSDVRGRPDESDGPRILQPKKPPMP